MQSGARLRDSGLAMAAVTVLWVQGLWEQP